MEILLNNVCYTILLAKLTVVYTIFYFIKLYYFAQYIGYFWRIAQAAGMVANSGRYTNGKKADIFMAWRKIISKIWNLPQRKHNVIYYRWLTELR
jgi:hypothetical protein